MSAFVFPSAEALEVALLSGFVPETVLKRPAECWYQDGEVWVLPSGRIPKSMSTELSRAGVVRSRAAPAGEAREVSSWLELIRPTWVGEADELPASVLFLVPGEQALLEVAGELFRLGCDRQQFAQVSTGHLLRAAHPPYFTVARAAEPGTPLSVFVPSATQDVWLQYGYQHALAHLLKPASGHLLLVESNGSITPQATPTWRDVYEVAQFVLGGQRRAATHSPLEKTLQVPVRLVHGATRRAAELWVLREAESAALDQLVTTLPESALKTLQFAAGELEGERVFLLRPGRGHEVPVLTPHLTCAAHEQIPNLYLPVTARLEPPLSADRLRTLLAPESDSLVWLQPTHGGDFDLCSMPDDAFRSLADWADYVIHSHHQELVPWVESAEFELDDYTLAPVVPPPTTVREGGPVLAYTPTADDDDREPASEPAPAEPPPKAKKKRRRSKKQRSRAAEPDVELTPEAHAEATPVAPIADDATSEQLQRHEAELLEELEAGVPEERWRSLAQAYVDHGGRQTDAGLSMVRWVWTAAEPAQAAADWAHLECNGQELAPALAEVLARPRPSVDETRLVAAGVWAFSNGAAEARAGLDELGRFLDQHEQNLDVRSRWLGRLGLTRMAGGDALGLSRLRDRLLADLRSGLSLSRDVPKFLRVFASGPTEELSPRLLEELADLEQWVFATQRQRGPMEAPEANTRAYLSLVFGYGYARLGERNKARKLSGPKLDLADPIHGFLVRAYQARIEQALEALAPTTPLPTSVAQELNQLARFLRYKVDRLREASTILEPVERLNAIRGFQESEDPRGAALAELRDVDDPVMLSEQVAKVVEQACCGEEPIESRARIIDGVMDFFVALPASQASEHLETIAKALGEVEPSYRVLLLEEALMNAGLVGHDELMRVLFSELSALLEELGPQHLLDVPEVLEGTLSTLRRVGWREQAGEFLQVMSNHLSGEDIVTVGARLGLSGGLAYLGDFEAAQQILQQAAQVSGQALPVPQRIQLVRARARALSSFPIDFGLEQLRGLREQLLQITDSYSTNSHFCLSVIQFVEALVLGYVGRDWGQGGSGRRWLDEDEGQVRQRVHQDLRKVLA